MRKALLLFLLIFGLVNVSIAAPTSGISFEQGLNSKKPMVVLLYAPWSEGAVAANKNMIALKKAYGSKANFITLNIAADETKYYNSMLPIQPNLPNIMMFKDKAKISRFIPKDCVLDYACVSKKANSFLH